jgi:hypothetical protein
VNYYWLNDLREILSRIVLPGISPIPRGVELNNPSNILNLEKKILPKRKLRGGQMVKSIGKKRKTETILSKLALEWR